MGKNQVPITCQWQSTSPVSGFLPLNAPGASYGTVPSGVTQGVMSGTNIIFSQIIDISRMDNLGAEVTWTAGGTAPTGTISILASCSGLNFYSLTFVPALRQPQANASGYLIDLNQMPYRYIFFQYANASGSGILTIYLQLRDI